MKVLTITVILFGASICLQAKPSDITPPNVEARAYDSKDGRTLPYRIFRPHKQDSQ